jgi:hypothetical protein
MVIWEGVVCRCVTGTIVDATLIDAPTSTKNSEGKRAPEMHQAKKINEGPNRRGWWIGPGAATP